MFYAQEDVQDGDKDAVVFDDKVAQSRNKENAEAKRYDRRCKQRNRVPVHWSTALGGPATASTFGECVKEGTDCVCCCEASTHLVDQWSTTCWRDKFQYKGSIIAAMVRLCIDV